MSETLEEKPKKKSKPKKKVHVCSTWNVPAGWSKLVCTECGKGK